MTQTKLEQIRSLEKIKTSSTSLISYYISSGSNLSNCQSMINKEISASSNIKSKSTRKSVIMGLKSIQNNLKDLKNIPQSGLAIFASHESYV
mgnify:CR=1 FL=1